MAIFKLKVNGKDQEVDVDPNTPILWVLRDHLDLVGTKFGCGVALCGACTVHLGGVGYCQAGQIMSAAALLKANPNPTDDQIEGAMSGNICRCGTYTRIKQAIKTAAQG